MIEWKKMKYLGINLTKYVQDLYNKNYKTLLREIFKCLSKWRNIPCSGIRILNIIEMSFPPNSCIESIQLQTKLEINKTNSKIYIEM